MAETYEQVRVPALFAQWTGGVLDAARVADGDRVLDIACGTGVLARAAAARGGHVAGLDLSAEMLAVARDRAPRVGWVRGDASRVPFRDEAFDAVVSQFGLMHFDDKVGAIREQLRVLRPQGRLAVAVWAGLEHLPAQRALEEHVRATLGAGPAEEVHDIFALGGEDVLRELFAQAGLTNVDVHSLEGIGRIPSARAWIGSKVVRWLTAGILDDAGAERLYDEVGELVEPYRTSTGQLELPLRVDVVTARRTSVA